MSQNTPRFRDLSPADRLAWLAERGFVDAGRIGPLLETGGLTRGHADQLIENVVGTFSMPVGIAQDLIVNDTARLVPMVIEEPSVVAAQCHIAKLVSAAGGFTSHASDPIMIGQVQLLSVSDPERAVAAVAAAESELKERARGLHDGLEHAGGGVRGVEARIVRHPDGEVMVVAHLHVDVRDAMGANMVNTVAEVLAPRLAELAGGRVGLRILSNLSDRRLVRTTCRIPRALLPWHGFSADAVADSVVAASRFAEADPYRAATHNKGIMNGVDAVLLATGNDWRAVEAGAHAWAARDGTYRPLSRFTRDAEGALCGELEMPMAVGIVGGATVHHPLAAQLLELMGVETAGELAEIAGAVGLAQNLAALKALGTEGIQRGHMRLHKRRLSR